MNDETPSDGIKLGDVVDGQMLVAVGIDFTFTEISDSHQAAFKSLDEWLAGIRSQTLLLYVVVLQRPSFFADSLRTS
jgi:hypothetical protein